VNYNLVLADDRIQTRPNSTVVQHEQAQNWSQRECCCPVHRFEVVYLFATNRSSDSQAGFWREVVIGYM
jgi:hypothetical protein